MGDKLNLPDRFKGFSLSIVKGDGKTVVKSVLLRAMVQALSDTRDENEKLANWARGYHQFLEMVLDGKIPQDVDVEKVLKKLEPIIDKYRLILG